MSNLLITGGAGFIGANFTWYWKSNHPNDRLFILDALTYAGNFNSIRSLTKDDNVVFIKGSICDSDLVENLLRKEQIDKIVNFAAESHVDRSISDPDSFIDTNIVGTYTLLKAAKKTWLDTKSCAEHRFHHVSTDEVFGSLDEHEPAFTESHQYLPSSPYSASKAASDHLVRAYNKTFGLNTTISHCSNNYGPYHFPEKLIPLCITNLLTGKPLPVYGDGKNIRDWLYVEDHCRGLDLILKKGTMGETYNIGGSNERSNLAVVELICKTLDALFFADKSLSKRYPKCPAVNHNSEEHITLVKDRPGHDRRYALATKKIQNELGFTAKTPFEQGIQKTIQWFLDNEEWWKPLIKPTHQT